jgi:hypothetical protein
MRCVVSGLAVAIALAWAGGAGAQPVTVDVVFKLTDLDYKPLSNVPVRIVFTSERDWQSPGSGQRIVTDAEGEAKLSATAVLDQRRIKKPTNFVSSLLSSAQQTDHLVVAAELEYMGYQRVYTVEVFHFPDGDDLLGEFAVYTRDDRGRFARKAERRGNDWVIPDLGGLVATSSGYEPWNFALQPDPTRKRWTLQLGLKKFPPAERR